MEGSFWKCPAQWCRDCFRSRTVRVWIYDEWRRGNNQETWMNQNKPEWNIQPGLPHAVLTTNIFLNGEIQKSLPTPIKCNCPWKQHASLVLFLPFPWNKPSENFSLCLGYFRLRFLIQSDTTISIYFLSPGGLHGWYVGCWNSSRFLRNSVTRLIIINGNKMNIYTNFSFTLGNIHTAGK